MNKKSNVTWVKPAEPTFLKKFKDDVGFQEGPTIDAKVVAPEQTTLFLEIAGINLLRLSALD